MFKGYRTFLTTAGLAVAFTAAAAVSNKALVNERLVHLLAMFQNDQTKVEIQFKDLEISETRVEKASIRAFYDKIGKHNRATLTVTDLSYKFVAKDDRPRARVKADFEIDLLKLLGQKEINGMVEEADDFIAETTKELTEKYGDAAEIHVGEVQVVRDSKEDVVSVEVEFRGSVDLKKLPETMPVEEVEWVAVKVNAKVGRTGGSIDLVLDVNPEYKAFKREEVGLKEWLEKLIANDRETYESIQAMVSFLDDAIEHTVNKEPKN